MRDFYDEFLCTLRTNKNIFDGTSGIVIYGALSMELLSTECKVEIDSTYICRNCCQR